METLLRMIPRFLPDVWREGGRRGKERGDKRRGEEERKKKGEKRVGEDESTVEKELSSTECVAKKATYLFGVIPSLVFCSPQRILSLLTVC